MQVWTDSFLTQEFNVILLIFLNIWSVLVEKTFVSPLDRKEIKPVSPKGDQPCIFIVRTDGWS